MISYPGDVMGLVNKGATSFHASEELWQDPLLLRTDMHPSEFADLRKGWDLLIDIDSPYLDYSKIAAALVLQTLERYGLKKENAMNAEHSEFFITKTAGLFAKSAKKIWNSFNFNKYDKISFL